MKVIADYVHSKGLKFGLYSSVGTTTCRGDPGSYGHYQTDADTFASWGIDYVKLDWCGQMCTAEGHKEFSHALNATKHPMVLELCRGTYQNEAKWGYAPSIAQSWRATGDHHDSWKSTLEQVKSVEGKSTWSGPYGWAYLDMLMTGGQGCKGQSVDQALHCPGQTNNEYRTEYSLYAIASSSLLIGTDIRNITAIMRELIFNPEVIAMNQDRSTPGDIMSTCNKKNDIWVRKLANGDIAVAATNLGDAPATLSVCFSDLPGGSSSMHVRDLWKRVDVGVFRNMYSRTVDVHDTMLLVLKSA